jgi:hypothetical protein
MSLYVPLRSNLSLSELVDLVKAQITIKGHYRKVNGRDHWVPAHKREVQTKGERDKLVRGLAKKMANDPGHTHEHANLANAAAVARRLSRVTGKTVHAYLDANGKAVTGHTAPTHKPTKHVSATAGELTLHHATLGAVKATALLMGRKLHQIGAKGLAEHAAHLVEHEGHTPEEASTHLHASHRAAVAAAIANGHTPSKAALALHPELAAIHQTARAERQAAAHLEDEAKAAKHEATIAGRQAAQEARTARRQERKSKPVEPTPEPVADTGLEDLLERAKASNATVDAELEAKARAGDERAIRRVKNKVEFAEARGVKRVISFDTPEHAHRYLRNKYPDLSPRERDMVVSTAKRANADSMAEWTPAGLDAEVKTYLAESKEAADLADEKAGKKDARKLEEEAREARKVAREAAHQELARKMLEHIHAHGETSLDKLREAMGHGKVDKMRPTDNAVHAALARMRDEKLLEVDRPSFGEPRVKLPAAVLQAKDRAAAVAEQTAMHETAGTHGMASDDTTATGIGVLAHELSEAIAMMRNGKPGEQRFDNAKAKVDALLEGKSASTLKQVQANVINRHHERDAFNRAKGKGMVDYLAAHIQAIPEDASGKKAGAQEGNDNAYKGGPKDKEKKPRQKATPEEEAAHAAKRVALVATLERAKTAYRATFRGMMGGEENARILGQAVRDAQHALVRHDHPEKEQSGDFQDVGEKIGGARKDVWGGFEEGEQSFSTIDWDAMAADPEQASRVINKKNLLAQSTPQDMRDAGMPAPVAFLATKILDTIAPRPPGDSNAARMAYAKGVERLQRAFMNTTDFQGIIGVIKDMRSQANGFEVPLERVAERDAMVAAGGAAYALEKTAEEKSKAAYKVMQDANNATYAIRRDRRGDTNLAKVAELAAAQAKADQVTKEWQALNTLTRAAEEHRRTAYAPLYKLDAALKALDRANPSSWHNTFAALGDRFEGMLAGKGAVWETHNKTAQRKIEDGDWSWGEVKEKAAPKPKPVKEAGEGYSDELDEAGNDKHGLPQWKRKAPEDAMRTGGKALGDVTAQSFNDMFGLRGTEYGNYVNPAEAKHHTQLAAEAFNDMAMVLGLDAKQVSYNGRLAMAFGARGKGRALAHYESGKKVINMTKYAGGGTLAHEWGHFLDNILTMVSHGGKGGDHSFMSDGINKVAGPELAEPIRAAYVAIIDAMHNGNVRAGKTADPEKGPPKAWGRTGRYIHKSQLDKALVANGGDAQGAMDALLDHYDDAPAGQFRGRLSDKDRRDAGQYLASKTGQTIFTERARENGISEFKQRSGTMGKGENNYWTRGHEMFARSWEAYVEDKCLEKGIENTYLVYGTRQLGSAHMPMDVDRVKPDGFAYPQGDERVKVNAAFDQLIAAIKSTDMLAKALVLDAPKRVLTPVVPAW